MNVSDFDYYLPERLIAQTPPPERTSSRLMVLHREDGRVDHRMFTDFAAYLRSGDTLVLNDTRVLPARLIGAKANTGARAELLLLKQLDDDRWEVLAKPGKKLRAGAEIHFGAAAEGEKPLLAATVEAEGDMGLRVVRFHYEGIFAQWLERLGNMPLPPYIKTVLEDRERYQTVYARQSGSAAAPTAGLHFTQNYLSQIEAMGVKLVPITLHVGLGTFRPVAAQTVEEHEMHAEWYEVSAESAAQLQAARESGRRIIAVGTTSARTLETLGQRFAGKRLEACSGWTDIFIYPGYTFTMVDALLTNFHLPKSTLLMLVSAFAGRQKVLAAYEEAVREQYRFFSFGDAMFITT